MKEVNLTIMLQDVLEGIQQANTRKCSTLNNATWYIEQAIDLLNNYEEMQE